jgi:prepilin-type N-terminal cleavage/methylation domain-containing protein
MRAWSQKGFSLVEAVVALAVASLIALSAAALYRASGQGASQARSAASPASRVLFEQLRELSSATYVQPVNPGCVSSACGGNGFHALIRTTDPSAGREFTYQVSYLPQEDGLYRAVDGRNPQRVYPGRGSVIFEFYDANGNRIYSSGTTTWVAHVVARVGEGAGSAAATFTMPAGGGGQNAAYSRQIPSAETRPFEIGMTRCSDDHDITRCYSNRWRVRDPSNLLAGFDPLPSIPIEEWIHNDFSWALPAPLPGYAGGTYIYISGGSSTSWASVYVLPPEVQCGRPPFERLPCSRVGEQYIVVALFETRSWWPFDVFPLTSGEMLFMAAQAVQFARAMGASLRPYSGPTSNTPPPWTVSSYRQVIWDSTPAWTLVPDSYRPRYVVNGQWVGTEWWRWLPLRDEHAPPGG